MKGTELSAAERTVRHDRLEQMRNQRRRIADAEVVAILERLDASGILALVGPWVHRRIGRHRTLSIEALLAGMFLTAARDSGRVTLTSVTDVLMFEISPGMRTRLGVPAKPDTDKGFEAGYAVVRRLFHALVAGCDPSPLPKNRRLDRSVAAAITAGADPVLLELNRARLVKLMNLIIQDSLDPVLDLLSERWDGSGSVDGTCVRAYSRGVRTLGPVTATDPDAAWHVRDGDHADPDGSCSSGTSAGNGGKKKRRKGDFKFGYETTLVIARDVSGDADPNRIPALVVGATLDQPGRAPGANAITVLADVRSRGHQAGWMAGDRAYNNSVPDEFQIPLAALGYRAVFDYKADQLGIQDQTQGALMVEGAWYCPSMPQPLIDATADLLAERIDPETWKRRVDARSPFRLYPKQHPDGHGNQRVTCPATAGKVICPLKKVGLSAPVGKRLPVVDPEPSPVGPPKVCRQHSITVPGDAGAKHGQDLAYGSDEWARVYHRLRNSVEGMNGYAKDPLHEAMEAGRTRRIRGIAATGILLAFQIAHANTRKIVNWVRTLPSTDGSPPLRRPGNRHKLKEPGTWTPAGHLDQPLVAA